MTTIDPKFRHSSAPNAASTSQPVTTSELKGPKQQRGASIAPSLAPKAQATGPKTRASADADPFVTFFVSTNAEAERSFGMPEKASDALEELAKKHKDSFQRLEPNELGSSLFGSDVIYKVRTSLIPALREACGEECSATELAKILTAPAEGPRDASIIGVLKDGNPLAKISALGALTQGTPPGLDPKQQLELVFAVANVASTVSALYGAVLRDTIQPRRAELLEARKAAEGDPKGVGGHFNAYFEAGARARAELAARGGTPEINTLAAKLLDCAKIIEGFGTPAANHMLDQLIDQGGGLVFDHVAATPSAARAIVDVWSTVMADSLAAIEQRFIAHEHLGGASGGHEHVSAPYDTVSVQTWREDFPFNEPRSKFAMLLGAKDPEIAKLARDAIFAAVVATDAKLPGFQAHHKAADIAEALERLPPEHRNNPEIVKSITQQQERRYAERGLTGVKDITFLIGGLAYGQSFEASAYDAAALAQNKGQLIVDLLKAVKTPELKTDLVDAAIGYYVLATQTPEDFASPKAKAVLADVIATATGASVPAKLAAEAGSVLAGKGCVQMFPDVLRSLRGDDTAARNAMNVIEAYLVVASGSFEGVTNADGFKSLSSEARAKLGELARSSVPQLRDILANGKSDWARLDAARLLAKCGADDLGDALSYLRGLASDELTTIYFSPDHAGTKNATARTHALDAMAHFGKSAEPARADLTAIAAIGVKANELVEYLTARAANNTYDYMVEGDPEALERCKAFFKAVATPKSRAQEALDFQAANKPEDLAKTPSYARLDQPFARGVVHEYASIGAAAQRTLDVLDGKARPQSES